MRACSSRSDRAPCRRRGQGVGFLSKLFGQKPDKADPQRPPGVGTQPGTAERRGPVFTAWTSGDLQRMLAVVDEPCHPVDRHFLLLNIVTGRRIRPRAARLHRRAVRVLGSASETARSTALRSAAADVIAELHALSSDRSDCDDRDAIRWPASLWAQWHGLALLHLGGWLDLHPRAALPKLLAEAVRSSSSAAASATTPLDGPAHLDQHRSGSSLDPSVTDEMTRDDDRR